MASREGRTHGFGVPRSVQWIVVVLALTAPMLGAAAPSYGAWKRVLAHRSKTQPYYACTVHRGRRCHLIVDPTRGSHRNGPVSAGAITTGPELQASPALKGSGVEGGFSPEDLRKAYLLRTAAEVSGEGQTVAVVDAFDDPQAEADMNAYRAHYHIEPAACTSANGCFSKINQFGGTSHPGASVEWSEEISLDLDMVSAVCPKCHILLVEAASESAADLAEAVEEAVAKGATEISNSYGSPVGVERKTAAILAAYDHPGIPITVAAGDEGYEVEEPADYPNVIAVGGTTLVPEAVTKAKPRGWKEKVWFHEEGSETSGTGSGCSEEEKPSWQKDPACAGRMNDDIAVVGDQETPVSAYDSYCGKREGQILICEQPWMLEGGTSVGTPLVAGAMALSGSYMRSFDGAHALYIDSLLNKEPFNDVTEGSNGTCTPPTAEAYFCNAEEGYDGPTGLGTLKGPPEIPQPKLTTEGASVGESGDVTLSGKIEPNDATFKECRFEYGTTNSYGASAPAVCPPETPESGLSPVSLSAHVTGLNAATLYHYRVSAVYQEVHAVSGTYSFTSGGKDATFTTSGAAPSVSTEPASPIGATAATLNAKVNSNGSSTECHFEYGKTPSFGVSVPCSPTPVTGQNFVAVIAAVANLSPQTTYHFRVVARNATGTKVGSELTFTTGAVLPAVAASAASDVTQTEATLNGSVNPEGVKVTECDFQYGRTTSYGSTIPCSTAPGEGQGAKAESAVVSGLQPGRSYHFRILARNANGTSASSDESFLTATEPPGALTESAVVGTSSATLVGTAVPNGAAISSCRFEYGTSPSGILEASAPCAALPASSEEGTSVSASITGLAAGTVYHYRLVVASSSGSTYGDTLAFTTAPATIQGSGNLEKLTGDHAPPGPGLGTLASRRLSVSARGRLIVRVRCSSGASACAGRISLRAAMAVGASSRRHRHGKRVVVLAAGPFRVGGGSVSTITLRLSHAARTLLHRSHLLHASATITPTAGKAARTAVTIRSR